MEEKKTTIKISVQTKIRLKKTAERLKKSGWETSRTYEDAIKALIGYYEQMNKKR